MVYLICFSKKYRHAKHYIGYTDSWETLERRLERHKNGDGSRLLRAVVQAGIEIQIVKVWEDGDKNFERRLKNQKNSRKLCPLCKEIRSLSNASISYP